MYCWAGVVAGCGGSGGNSNASNQAPSEITVVNDDSSNRSEDDFLTTGTNRTSKNQQQATEAKTESGNDIAQAAKTEVMENVEIAKTAAAVLLEQEGTSLPQKFIGMCDENTTWTKFNNYLHSHALDKNADPITKGKWEKTDDFKKRMKTFWPEKIQSIGVNDKFFIYTKNISKLLDEHYDVDQELLKGYDL